MLSSRALALRLAFTVYVITVIFCDFFSEPSTARYLLLPRALLEQGTVEISSYVTNPEQTADIAFVGKRIYPGTYPGVALCLIPVVSAGAPLWQILPSEFHQLFQDDINSFLCFLSILFVSAPAFALATFLFFITLRGMGIDDRRNILWTLGLTLGTPLLFYSARLHEAPLVFLLMAWLLKIHLLERALEKRDWALTGIAFGGLHLINPMAMVIAVATVFSISWRNIRMTSFAPALIGYLPFGLLLRFYLWAAFGNPFAQPYHYAPNSIVGVWEGRGAINSTLEIIRVMPEIVGGMTFGIRGLFIFAPLALYAVVMLFIHFKERAARAGLTAYLINQGLLLTFIHGVWAGGTSWGPRYLLPCLPWIFAGAAMARSTRGLTPFVIASIFITWLGVQFGSGESPLPHIYYFLLAGPTLPLTRLWSINSPAWRHRGRASTSL